MYNHIWKKARFFLETFLEFFIDTSNGVRYGMSMKIMISKKHRKNLFLKIAPEVCNQLNNIREEKGLSWLEIAYMAAIGANRLSELNKTGALNEETFKGLLMGNMIDIEKIIKNVELTDQEREYLSIYGVLGIKEISKELDRLRSSGIDVSNLLSQFLKTLKSVR